MSCWEVLDFNDFFHRFLRVFEKVCTFTNWILKSGDEKCMVLLFWRTVKVFQQFSCWFQFQPTFFNFQSFDTQVVGHVSKHYYSFRDDSRWVLMIWTFTRRYIYTGNRRVDTHVDPMALMSNWKYIDWPQSLQPITRLKTGHCLGACLDLCSTHMSLLPTLLGSSLVGPSTNNFIFEENVFKTFFVQKLKHSIPQKTVVKKILLFTDSTYTPKRITTYPSKYNPRFVQFMLRGCYGPLQQLVVTNVP